jgi:hypothetical protein
MSRGVEVGLPAGEYNTFTCSWGDDDQPKQVEWYKRITGHPHSDIHFWRYIWSPSTVSNHDLDESHRSFSVASGTNKTQHTIRIENLEAGDTGVYRCEVKIGEKIYESISPNWLTVHVPTDGGELKRTCGMRWITMCAYSHSSNALHLHGLVALVCV